MFIGLIWFAAFVVLQGFTIAFPDQKGTIAPIFQVLHDLGWGLASFIRPILQLALVFIILIEAAKRVGLLSEDLGGTFLSFTQSASIQAIIAIIIVVAVSISALAAGNVDVLKDLALVVVGFYFGSRRAQNEAEAIAAGVAAGAAVAPQNSSESANSNTPRS